ncbi:UNVERIFIED_CONTAM: hypothetical protein FKN15_077060 [Acipenser sinensis]
MLCLDNGPAEISSGQYAGFLMTFHFQMPHSSPNDIHFTFEIKILIVNGSPQQY